ncbi:MAG TPA: hypothetical protein VHC43_00260 [Mycobacteriales bacterium]|nr:hypothetical protein [Mycobacteriales bacterium]
MPARSPSVVAIRRACRSDAAEGTTRLLFVRDGGRIGLVQTPQETANDADQFFALYLERMITDVAAPAVVVAVHRAEGRPTYSDRQLWTMLRARIEQTPVNLLDLVVVGASRTWSARHGRPLSAGRRSASRAAAR